MHKSYAMRPLPFLAFLILFIALQSIYATSITVNGNVSGTWDVDTVRVVDDIDVEEDDSLFIMPGVRVEFRGSYSFYVRGVLKAVGTSSQPIVFDVMDTTCFSVDTIPAGGWNGIQFYYNVVPPDSSLFEHCIFRHAKAVSPDTLENHGGAMNVRYSGKLRVSHCVFQHNFALLNGGAIYLEEADIVISHCDFTGNRCGPVVFPWGYGGAICSDHSSPHIKGNQFTGNASTGVGGAVAIRFRDARVHNNIFTANHSGLGGALGYLHYYEYPHSQCNNLLYGNTSEFFGGAVASIDAGPTFVNNTITGNASIYGGAFYVKDSLIPAVYNSIFWNNSAQVGPEVYLWDALSSADFYYCDVEGGPELFGGSGGGAGYTGAYENNIDLNPLFTENFRLDDGASPCMNTGTPDTSGLMLPTTDLDGMPRIDIHAHLIDMGCYEMQWVGITDREATGRRNDIVAYPNPAISTVRILLNNNSEADVLHIFNSAGQSTAKIQIPAGQIELVLDVSGYSPGTYIIRMGDAVGGFVKGR